MPAAARLARATTPHVGRRFAQRTPRSARVASRAMSSSTDVKETSPSADRCCAARANALNEHGRRSASRLACRGGNRSKLARAPRSCPRWGMRRWGQVVAGVVHTAAGRRRAVEEASDAAFVPPRAERVARRAARGEAGSVTLYCRQEGGASAVCRNKGPILAQLERIVAAAGWQRPVVLELASGTGQHAAHFAAAMAHATWQPTERDESLLPRCATRRRPRRARVHRCACVQRSSHAMRNGSSGYTSNAAVLLSRGMGVASG